MPYIMCSECTILNRSHKEFCKSTGAYRYTCKNKPKHWFIHSDDELKKLSCGKGSKEKIQNVKNIENKVEQLSLF